MPEVSVAALKETVENLSGAGATFRETASVHEEHEGQMVWQGEVAVFDLKGHPSASIAYAWSDPGTGSDRRCFYVVLHKGPVKSPEDAVRASIAHAYRDARGPSN